jgi:hypothetical protein
MKALERFVGEIASARALVGGVALWALGVWTTMLFLTPILPDWTPGARLIASVATQFVLTAVQSLAWSSDMPAARRIGYAALGADVLLNYAGLYPLLSRAPQTAAWSAASALLPGSTSSPALTIAMITLFLSVVIAVAPEFMLFRRRA